MVHRERWIYLSFSIALLVHALILYLASNYHLDLIGLSVRDFVQTKIFIVTSLPFGSEKQKSENLLSQKFTYPKEEKSFKGSLKPSPPHVFNSELSKVTPTQTNFLQTSVNLADTSPFEPSSFLRIDQNSSGTEIPDSVFQNQDISKAFSLPYESLQLNFDLPLKFQDLLANENLPSKLNSAFNTDSASDQPFDYEYLSQLFDPNLVQALETPQGIVLRISDEVLFEFDSANLSSEAIPVLKQIAQLLRRYAGAQVSIEGHTDTIGPAEYNQKLSELRAQTVANWLTSQPAMVFRNPPQIVGYGESRPLVNPLGSRDEQKKNRRVEIHILAVNRSD